MHVKSLRRSMDPLRLLPALVAPCAASPAACCRSTGTATCWSPTVRGSTGRWPTQFRRAVSTGHVEVRVHDFLSDAALWEYLAGLDVSVLPYRFGTHSGWLEACRDLGTTVVAPSCGFFAEQAPVLTYVHDESRTTRAPWRRRWTGPAYLPALGATTVDERRVQRAQIAAAHERLYRSLLS